MRSFPSPRRITTRRRGRERPWIINRHFGGRDGARPSKEPHGQGPLLTPGRGRPPSSRYLTLTCHELLCYKDIRPEIPELKGCYIGE